MQSTKGDPQRFLERIAIRQRDSRARCSSPTRDGLGEATSTPAPEVNTIRAEEVAIMPEVNTSSQQDTGEKHPEVIQEGLGQSSAQPIFALASPLMCTTPLYSCRHVLRLRVHSFVGQ